MRSNPTVVIPAYNEVRTIGATLDALHRQTEAPSHIIVVNNASTDDTPNIVHDRYPGVTLLHEPQKGTGYAANTGFRHAIDVNGARVIMRTDADTVPAKQWVASGGQYLSAHQNKLAVSGKVLPLKDEHWKLYDEVALPLSYVGYRVGVSMLKRSRWPLRVLRGANMAIRASTFSEVGGFPDGTIAEVDDDIELGKRVHHHYGFEALANVGTMVVRTSTRRIRALGYHGLLPYYLNFSGRPMADKRNKMTVDGVDIR